MMEECRMYSLIIFCGIIFFFLIYLIIDNLRIKVRKINVKLSDKNKKKESKKYKIIHISDFHNQNRGKENQKLLSKIKSIKPDYIFITGDLIDRKKTNPLVVSVFLDDLNKILKAKDNKANKKSRIFYVYGNHEKSKSYEFLEAYEEMLKLKGVILLKDEVAKLFLNDKQINIIGMDDPYEELVKFIRTNEIKESFADFFNRNNTINKENLKIIESKIHSVLKFNEQDFKNSFNILLTHRPEGFPVYNNYDIDLVLAGHAHGGLIRLPFTNLSLIAPNQSFLPKYTKGPYIKNNTVMYVNLGLGHSVIHFRIFAAPEIILINLEI